MVDASTRLALSGSDRSAGVATIVTALNRVAESTLTVSRRGALVVSWARATFGATSKEIIAVGSETRTDNNLKNTGPPMDRETEPGCANSGSGGRLGRQSQTGGEA
jgi:hypothetical protein